MTSTIIAASETTATTMIVIGKKSIAQMKHPAAVAATAPRIGCAPKAQDVASSGCMVEISKNHANDILFPPMRALFARSLKQVCPRRRSKNAKNHAALPHNSSHKITETRNKTKAAMARMPKMR